jgi:hypothetical protein
MLGYKLIKLGEHVLHGNILVLSLWKRATNHVSLAQNFLKCL